MRITPLFVAAAAALFTACSTPAPVTETAKPALGTFGIDLAHRDDAVKPGDDFFRYANGKWLATFQIPADKARYGSFDALADKAETDVKAIVEELAAGSPAAGTTPAKVGALYSSWMDESTIEARGIEPLRPYLDQIAAVSDTAGVIRLMSTTDFAAPLGIGIEADPDDPTRYAVWAGQGGIGMPDRDYYLKEGAAFEKYRGAYKAYVTKIFELVGDAAPAASADVVIALEKKIAQAHWSQESLRDVQKSLNTMTYAEFKAFAPSLQWDGVMAGLGLPAMVDKVVAYGDTAVRDGARLIRSEPVAAWKKYLAFHIASDNAAHLPKAFADASFEFFGEDPSRS